jgi:Tfp pilus assembly protein PilE
MASCILYSSRKTCLKKKVNNTDYDLLLTMKFDENYYRNNNYVHFKNISIEDKCALTYCQMYLNLRTLAVTDHEQSKTHVKAIVALSDKGKSVTEK